MTWHEIVNIVLVNIKTILKITAISTVVFLLVLIFVVPVTYKSEITVLPPEKSSQLSGLGSLFGSSEISNLVSGGVSSANSQLYGEILKSRTASLYVVSKLNLISFLNAQNKYEAAEKLSKALNLNINKEGILELSVDIKSSFFPMFIANHDTLKDLSAQISNSFIEALDHINREKNISKARSARIYIESQLLLTKSKMDSAETSLLDFQKKNKTVSLPNQVEAVLKNAAELKFEIVKTEMQIKLMESDLNENNRIVQSLQRKLEALNEQYSKFEIGSKDYMLAIKDIPEIGRDLTSILREIRIQNEVYALLQQQYYKEKIQENRDLPTVQVLDFAIPPTKKESPRIIITTLLGMIIIFVLTASLFLIKKN